MTKEEFKTALMLLGFTKIFAPTLDEWILGDIVVYMRMDGSYISIWKGSDRTTLPVNDTALYEKALEQVLTLLGESSNDSG